MPPPVETGIATTIDASTEFLYTGPDAPQVGVAPGTIVQARAAVIRGRVLASDETPLAGVTVTVLDHPEYGHTVTGAEGMFDLAVNGGGRLVVTYAKAGLLPAQREVLAPWQDFVRAADVILLPYDAQVTAIDLASPVSSIQVARGSETTDADGTRRATLLFRRGTAAAMSLPAGASEGLATLHIRATEHTVGPRGPAAMPASLPAATAYTYAVDLSVDEAVAAGATEVAFSQPVPFYVENFLGFPVGTPVPAGWLDRARGVWVPSANGRVISVVAIGAGLADLDVDGDGVADDATSLGVTTDERAQLATLYAPGQSLWRVELGHFSSWDLNWGFGPPPGATAPGQSLPADGGDDRVKDECLFTGSIIGCNDQSLQEEVGVVGTPFRLVYKSDRVPGFAVVNTLRLPLSGSTLPPGLQRIVLEIEIAGRLFTSTHPAAAGQTASFTWDGRDCYGRQIQGAQPVAARIGYVYQGSYQRVEAFGYNGNGIPITGSRTRQEVTLWQVWRGSLTSWDARAQGLAGWTLNVHHAYDPTSRVLYQGDGRRRSAHSLGDTLSTVVRSIGSEIMAAGPDGSLYFREHVPSATAGLANGWRVRRVGPDGVIHAVAGTGSSCPDPIAACGDGGPALAAALGGYVTMVQPGDDGSVYIAENPPRIRRVGRDGIITTVAGDGTPCLANDPCGDGGPALSAQLGTPYGLAVASDGTIYVKSSGQRGGIRRIGPDGVIATVPSDPWWDRAGMIAAARDGSLFVSYPINGTVHRIGTDGAVAIVAGGGTTSNPDGIPATQAYLTQTRPIAVGRDGALYLMNSWGPLYVNRVGTDGILTKIAGGVRPENPTPDGSPSLGTSLHSVLSLAVGPDNTLYVNDYSGGAVFKRAPPMPGLSQDDILIPSEDGSALHVFAGNGRHLRTIHAWTGAIQHRFVYDAEGRLASVEDADGNVTVIERDEKGTPTALVAPGGQRTTLEVGADGFLSRIGLPGGRSVTATSGAGGLLASLTDVRGGLHLFDFDAQGRLVRDEDPAGGVKTLARVETAGGHTVTVTTGLGRSSTYKVERLPDGSARRENSDPTGARTVVTTARDGSQTATLADGSVMTSRFTPDPRFGMLAPVAASTTRVFPSGRTETVTRTVAVAWKDPLASRVDPMNLGSLTETIGVNGRTATRVYTAATRTYTSSSPSGRQVVTTLDAKGRVASQGLGAGIAPIEITRDARGRTATIAQGDQSFAFAYDAASRPVSRTDALGRTTLLAWDDANRLVERRSPGGAVETFTHDAAGNVTGVALPSGAAHVLGYTPVDLLETYAPPGGGTFVRSYDADRKLTSVKLPGGRSVVHGYDPDGRVASIVSPEATTAFAYLAGAAGGACATCGSGGRASRITRTPAAGPTQEVTFSHDGRWITGEAWAGATPGQLTYVHDAQSFVGTVQLVSGGDDVTLAVARDADGLITRSGPFSVSRGQAGLPTALSDGTLAAAATYDALARLSTRTHAVAGQQRFTLALTYDAAGRVVARTETIAGTASTSDYGYDAAGRLTQVVRDGATAEVYGYDANGNRISRRIGAGPAEPATYDAQDRLTGRGAVTYRFDPDGYLAERGTETFRYGARGELLEATIASGTISYSYDGLGRRVARSDGSGTRQFLYANPGNAFELTATRDPAGVLTVLHRDEAGLVVALQRGGAWFYVASDQAGSPRVVSDATGATVKVVRYDAFGAVLADSAPGFELPIGYAGGLPDPATGLILFGLRDYEPASGRWTARDPILFDGGQGNLYAYAGNDPVGRRDPVGLACIAVSQYAGAGAGVQTCIDDGGVTVCFETGFGLGADISGDWDGKSEETSHTIGLQGEAALGPASAGADLSLDNKGCLKFTPAAEVGPVTLGPDGLGWQLEVEDAPQYAVKGTRVKLQGKLYGKKCFKRKF